jgi:hypothetical protein
VVIPIAIALCSGTTIFALDRLCYGNLTQRLPLYPNAEIVRRTHNLFSEFGMGITVITMKTSDDAETVRAWYAVRSGAYLREAVRENTPFFRMAQSQVDVTRDPDSPGGTGSQIILFGTCVN